MDWITETLTAIGLIQAKEGSIEVISPSKEEENERIERYIRQENPLDRVKRLFLVNPDTSERYVETQISSMICVATACTVGSAVFGLTAPRAKSNFLQANAVTVYKTRWLAERQAMDAFMLGGLRKAGKWGLITYLIVKPFMVIGQGIEFYRVKTSPMNFTVSGGIVGAASRVLLGPQAMLAGGLIGGYFGLLTGFLSTKVLQYTSCTFEERYKAEIKEKLEAELFYEEQARKVTEQLQRITDTGYKASTS